jgi:hypothetical protein
VSKANKNNHLLLIRPPESKELLHHEAENGGDAVDNHL